MSIAALLASLPLILASAPPPSIPATAAAVTAAFPSAESHAQRYYALRLRPGQDPLAELQRFARERGLHAAFIASCVGSLTRASIRYANQPAATMREGHFEIVSLSDTLAAEGTHLHIACADSTGFTFGGHLATGGTIYTTAEIVLGELDDVAFAREPDSTYGYRELVPRPR